MNIAARPLTLAACFALCSAFAIRAQVQDGTHINVYGYIVIQTHGDSDVIPLNGYTQEKKHEDSWRLDYTRDDRVKIHCDKLREEIIEIHPYSQGPTAKVTIDTVYDHQPAAALGDESGGGNLEIVWTGGQRNIQMSNGLTVQVKQTVTTTTEYRDGTPKKIEVVPGPTEKWQAFNYLFHLNIQDHKYGFDIAWEPNSNSGAVTTLNDYSFYIDNGKPWLTVFATWVVSP